MTEAGGAALRAPAETPRGGIAAARHAEIWADATLAAALAATDPAGLGGVCLRARHGPVRDRWLEVFGALNGTGVPSHRIAPGADDQRIFGGIDLGATLAEGRPVQAPGLIAEAASGVLTIAMAEAIDPARAVRIAGLLDCWPNAPSRLAPPIVVALDEGAEPDERADPALSDRLALWIDLTELAARETGLPGFGANDVVAARAKLPDMRLGQGTAAALTTAAARLGIASLRAPIAALACARAAMALFGPALAKDGALEIAARLVLAPRAKCLPPPPEEHREPPPPEPDVKQDDRPPPAPGEMEALTDRVLEAVAAALPVDLLASLKTGALLPRARIGRAGQETGAATRGRPAGSRPGRIAADARIDIAATVAAAAPWQRLRAAESSAIRENGRLSVRTGDIRIKRLKRQSATATIFVVDASGSAAIGRLAETKGAIELLLAEAYVRRDKVALVAFRGDGAEVLLPPTAAPALAKRRLAALPGGGGTPLAAGLGAGLALAGRLQRDGVRPSLLVLTDGRANIALDGSQGRPRATEDALAIASEIARAGYPSLVIDTSPRPRREAAALAEAMGARTLALPRADAAAIGRAGRALLSGA